MSTEPDNPNLSSASRQAYEQLMVMRAQDGEQEAMVELVKYWSPRLSRHAYRLTNRPEATKDVMQESWLAIVKGLNRLRDPALFRPWAYRIVGNQCASWVRRQQKARRTIKPLEQEPIAREHDNHLEDRIYQLRQALRELPRKEKILLSMFYLDQLKISEIAQILDHANGTIKRRLFEARNRLREIIERQSKS